MVVELNHFPIQAINILQLPVHKPKVQVDNGHIFTCPLSGKELASIMEVPSKKKKQT